MIARIFILLIFIIVLPDLYLYERYIKRHPRFKGWRKWVWWIPCALMLAYTIALASIRNFVPDDLRWIYVYFTLAGIFVIPKAAFVVSIWLGRLIAKATHSHFNHGHWIGYALGAVLVGMYIYSITIGPKTFAVRHIDLYYNDLPAAFDGFRIVHFSDAHIGSFNHVMDHALLRDLDSIKAAHPDIICFTGDLQNLKSDELQMHWRDLRSLTSYAPVYSVLGNHDYSYYTGGTPAERQQTETALKNKERQMRWTMLNNAHTCIIRGNDTLWIAGEEWADTVSNRHCPPRADLRKTINGIPAHAFIVMLEHNPKDWEKNILPHTRAQLTLSGHTHAGQVSIFGIRPTMFNNSEDYGLYKKHHRYLYVTSGLNGAFPCRLGATPEIAVITLHCKTHNR